MNNICPTSDKANDLGTPEKAWGTIYVNHIVSPDLNTDIANDMSLASAKTTLLNTDTFPFIDASNILWKIQWGSVVSTLNVLFAPIANPTFTGVPRVPTAGIGTDTTQAASTAFANAAVASHVNDVAGAHAGTAISNTPAGNITSITVQGALNELDTSVTGINDSLENYLPLTGGTMTGQLVSTTITTEKPAALNNSTLVPSTSWLWDNIQALVAGCIAAVAVAAGFESSIDTSGYIKFPTWLGGGYSLLIQWGEAVCSGSSVTTTFTKAYSTRPQVLVSSGNDRDENAAINTQPTTTQFTINTQGVGMGTCRWLSIGRG